MKFILTIGNTETARIDGISAAGANPDLMVHTPSADAEILTYGRPTQAPVVPVSPTGCPTPAVISRAARELLGFETIVIDAGAASPTTAPTVTLPGPAGDDIREAVAVSEATAKFGTAREYGQSLPDDELVVAETIPGGTTTAMGVLSALGEQPAVSSSLPENPLELKQSVVSEGLESSGLVEGDLAGESVEALRAIGDPVLAAVAGVTVGALESGIDVTLGGGTQMSAAAALVRHFGMTDELSQTTTSFIAADETANVRALAETLDIDLAVTDAAFTHSNHPAMEAFVRGEAKEGVGMGGALALVDESDDPDVTLSDLHEQIISVYDRLLAKAPADHPATKQTDSIVE